MKHTPASPRSKPGRRSSGHGLLRVLQQERTPFALLAIIALAFRLFFLTAAPALAAQTATEGGSATGQLSFILCSPIASAATDLNGQASPDAQNAPILPAGDAHDPGHCLCAAGCFHGLSQGALLPGPAVHLTQPLSAINHLHPIGDDQRLRAQTSSGKAIRAPPSA